jgi:4-hydroxybenzoyl-CoA reductase subunit beta
MATLIGNVCIDNKCSFFNQTKFWWQSRPDCFKRGGDRCYVVKGGKQCYALSVGDTVSALIVLEAELSITAGEGDRHLPIETFYTGDGRRPHHLNANELVTSVRIPPSANEWYVGFLKKSIRGSVDFAIATLSMRLRKNSSGIKDTRIALNGVSTKPIRAKKAEMVLTAKGINAESVNEATRLVLAEAKPLSLIGASILVRRQMIAAMVEDLVEELTL